MSRIFSRPAQSNANVNVTRNPLLLDLIQLSISMNLPRLKTNVRGRVDGKVAAADVVYKRKNIVLQTHAQYSQNMT